MSSGVDVIARLTSAKAIYVEGSLCGSILGQLLLQKRSLLKYTQKDKTRTKYECLRAKRVSRIINALEQ